MTNNIFKIENGIITEVLDKTIESAVVPDGVEIIHPYVFENCRQLKSVTIPNSVTYIGYGAFYNCTELTNVTLPNGLEIIGDDIFHNCQKLPDITIPESVTIIGARAFGGCKSLTEITIPNGVERIGFGAFSFCKQLKSISIPNTVTRIDLYAFSNCHSLESIVVPNSIREFEASIFERCYKLKSKKANYKMFYTEDGYIYFDWKDFKENKWSRKNPNTARTGNGYQFCTNLFDIFEWFDSDRHFNKLDENMVIYECEVGDVVIKNNASKCTTNKIKPIKRLYREDMLRLLNV